MTCECIIALVTCVATIITTVIAVLSFFLRYNQHAFSSNLKKINIAKGSLCGLAVSKF